MFVNNEQQLYLFLWAFVPGLLIGMLYIVISAVRVIAPPGRVQLFVGDALFMLAASMITFLFAVAATEGKIRLYTLTAEVAAFVLLYCTAGRFFIKILAAVLQRIRTIFEKVKRRIIDAVMKIFHSVTNLFYKKGKLKKI